MEEKKVEKKKSATVQKWTSVTDRQKHRHTDTEDGQTDGCTDGQTDGRKDVLEIVIHDCQKVFDG